MQAKMNEKFQWIVGILLVAVLAFNIVAYNAQEDVVVPSAEEIAALVVVPAVNSTDYSEKLDEILDQVDTRTDVSENDADNAIEYADEELSDADFKELVAKIIDIDEEDFVIKSLDVKDVEVTTASEDDNEDGNFKVEKFIRVVYHDTDADRGDNDVVYVVLTADITDLYDEENDQDVEYSLSEVLRSFEFD